MTPIPFRQTAYFRLATAYVLLFATVFFTQYFITKTITRNAGLQAFQHELKTEHETLSKDILRLGLSEGTVEINNRIGIAKDHTDYFLLISADGHKLAGNLDGYTGATGWSYTQGGEAILFSGKLNSGDLLAVGHSLELVRAAEAELAPWLYALMIGSSLAAASIGYFFMRKPLQQFNAIARACEAYQGGDMTVRIPVGAGLNAAQTLSARINGLFDSNQKHFLNVKYVSSNIAHELRAPLSKSIDEIQVALLAKPTVKTLSLSLEHVGEQCRGLLGTLDSLLQISMLESGAAKQSFAPVDISQLVGDVAEAFNAVAAERGSVLVTTVEDEISCAGDRKLLANLLANLIENSILHTPSGSRVEVALKRAGADCALLSVADNGPGIPTDLRAKVLQKFFRVPGSDKPVGSGVGLSIVEAIADIHGFELALQDHRPGLRVTLNIPTGV